MPPSHSLAAADTKTRGGRAAHLLDICAESLRAQACGQSCNAKRVESSLLRQALPPIHCCSESRFFQGPESAWPVQNTSAHSRGSARVTAAAHRVASRRNADQRGEIADQKNHPMAQRLQLAHFVQRHRMAEVNIRRGWIESEFDPQRRARFCAVRQLLREFILNQQFIAAAANEGERMADFVRN